MSQASHQVAPAPFVSYYAGTKDNTPTHYLWTLRGLNAVVPVVQAPVGWNEKKQKHVKELPMWSPATYAPGVTRSKEAVQRLHFLAVDIDDDDSKQKLPGDTYDRLLTTLKECSNRFGACLQTSYNHTPEHPRVRITVQLSRWVTPPEYQELWTVICHLVREALGGCGRVDPATKDVSRCYFIPAVPNQEASTWYRSELTSEVPANVEHWLDVARQLAVPQLPPPVKPANDSASPPTDLASFLANPTMAKPSKNVRCPSGSAPEQWFETLCRVKHPPAVSGENGQSELLRLANYGAIGLNLDPAVAAEIAWEHYNPRCDPSWGEQERASFERKFTEAKPQGDAQPGYLLPRESANDSDGTRKKKVRADESLVLEKLREHWADAVAYDSFACTVVAKQPIGKATAGAWTDFHTTSLKLWLQTECWLAPSKEAVDGAVELIAREHTFHPVQDYLNHVQWDGNPRLSGMLENYFGSPSSHYVQRVGRCWMISAVARAMDPGCKVDHMIILRGDQGLRKSSALRVLASPDWFSDTQLDFGSKDSLSALPGKWIIEIGELHAFSRTEVTQIKAFVTSQADKFRPAYGRRDETFKRTVVFAGTTNNATFLRDTTGNRRFWVVECPSDVDLNGLAVVRDQLWAEAVHAYRNGERWWLNKDDEEIARQVQANYEDTEDPWEAAIVNWLKTGPLPITGALLPGAAAYAAQTTQVMTHFTSSWVLEHVLGMPKDRQRHGDATRVSNILRRHGWVSKNHREGASVYKAFKREGGS